MKNILLCIIYIFSFSQLLLGAQLKGEEINFLKGIKPYSKSRGYLSKEDLGIVEKLQKKPLVMGYELDYDIDPVILKDIFKKHLNIEVILVQKNWKDLLKDLENGDIDLLPNLTYIKDRENFLEYSKPYYNDIIYLTHPTNTNMENLSNLDGRDVFVTSGSAHSSTFDKLEKLYNINIIESDILSPDFLDKEIFFMTDRLFIYSQINSGVTNLNYRELFTAEPIHFGVSKKLTLAKREVILKILDRYAVDKVSKYLNQYSLYLNKIHIMNLLSKEEIEYLTNLKFPSVALEIDQYYISYQDLSSGINKGSWVELISLWMDSYKDIKLTPIKTFNQKVEFLNTHPNSIALIPLTWNNIKKFSTTEPLYSLEYFLVENKYMKNSFGTIGIPKNSYFLENFLSNNGNKNYKIFPSPLEMIQALENNELSGVILSEFDLRYFQGERLKTFLSLKRSLGSVQLALATNPDNKILLSVLKKYVNFSQTSKNIIKKWEYSPNLIGVKYQKQNKALYVMLTTLLFFTAILIVTIKKLYNGAYYDPVLGLPNERKLRKSIGNHSNIGLATIALSNYAEIQDVFTEDEIIKEIKTVLRRAPFQVYKLNKNEYAMLLEGQTQENCFKYIEDLYKRNSDIYMEEIRLNFKYGLSHMRSSKSSNNLIKNSLYSLHLFDKNKKIVLGDPLELEKHRVQKKLEYTVEIALMKDFYTPYFQPKISMKNKKIVGAEILSRLITDDGQFISPGIFIPVLEDLNLIYKLDLQVLEKSLVIVKGWLDRSEVDKSFVISQNLSVKTLEHDDIFIKLKDIIKKIGFPLENLEFEVTETAFSKDITTVSNNLSKIKNMGVVISLDDFSVGNSSVSYINKLPIEIIKFDMSMLPTSDDERASINIFLSLSETFKNLGYRMVAEGVETKWQEKFLETTCINEGQGYYYSKPLDSNSFEKWLKGTKGDSPLSIEGSSKYGLC